MSNANTSIPLNQSIYDMRTFELKRVPRSPDPEADALRRKRQFVRHSGQPRQQYRRPVIVTPNPAVNVFSAADTGIEKRFFTKKRNTAPSKRTTRSPIYQPPTYNPEVKLPSLSVEPDEHDIPSPPALYYDFKPTVTPFTAESIYTTSVDLIPGPPYDEHSYDSKPATAWPASYSYTTSPNPAPLPGATYYKPLAPSQNTIVDSYGDTGAGDKETESIYREATTHFHPGDVVHRGSKELVRDISTKLNA